MPELSLEKSVSNTISQDNWKDIGFKKRAGVLIPLFTVHSKNSFGLGDLGDLRLIIDWAKLTAQSIIQLLPMNEVGPLFCPYDALSSFALEPAYICLKEFPALKEKRFKSTLDDSLHVDYTLKQEKLQLLWDIYLAQDLSVASDFETFQQKNSYWLPDFALFKLLKDNYQGQPWYVWEEKFKNRNHQALQEFAQDNIEKITFQMWLQWILFRQLRAARDYAVKNNILLKGDLPVLVSRDSADVWAHPEFFKLDFAAGAPPDMYTALGQRWGMPTYNWENIAKDDYRYLKEKLKIAQEFYNILRIDHVVGFFRIWSIPYNDRLENQGLNGFFDPSDEHLWAEHGRRILSVLVQNTTMLLCAEDLGVIPKCCTDTLLEFGIPGNDVQRWVKDWKVKHDFSLPEEYRQLSVAMLSTHDTTNWKAWWQYEAGTVDAGLFIRKCKERGIDFVAAKEKLFNPLKSFHGRLRWLDSIDSVDKLILGLSPQGVIPKDHLMDFVDLYLNTFQEKEKLWKLLNCSGQVTQEASKELLAKIIQFTLNSRAIFCVQSISDWLGLADIFKGDPYQYRVNVPGTISPQNWSLRLPLTLEQLLKHPLNKQIRKMIVASGRI